MRIKITVCELPNDPGAFAGAWDRLVGHAAAHHSDLVLLPEMPFYRWLAHSRTADARQWELAVAAHREWIPRFHELAPAWVLGTRPVITRGKRRNVGYLWKPDTGIQDVHGKYHLPDEPGFWEASWYQRGDGTFSPVTTTRGTIGFLICTELWFFPHARRYARQGVHLLACPRATPRPSAEKWVAGGRAAAVVSGAFCISSNLSGTTPEGGDFAGVGWIIEPEEGNLLGVTTAEHPFLTLEVNLADAENAKKTYPRYVPG